MIPRLILVWLLLTPGAAAQSPENPSDMPIRPPATTSASSAPEAPGPIQDNSFLLEEAYNQEAGVIQHISSFQRSASSGDWYFTFTEEWPVPGQRHQLSVTVPYLRIHESLDRRSALGDVFINYRYQLTGSSDSRVAMAPRFSLVLPAGDARESRGSGAYAYQVNVPLSVELNGALVTHVNAGFTATPGSLSPRGDSADTVTWNLGQSLIWLARPAFNLLVELAYARGQIVTGPGHTEPARLCFVNPGVRWAMTFKSGLQIVPGVSLPIGIGPSRGNRAFFLYLSLEHPLWKAQ